MRYTRVSSMMGYFPLIDGEGSADLEIFLLWGSAEIFHTTTGAPQIFANFSEGESGEIADQCMSYLLWV